MLFERLLGRTDGGDSVDRPIPPHWFYSLLCEVARGNRTRAQAAQDIADVTLEPLSPEESAEAGALLDSVLAPPSLAAKLERATEIHDVLMLGELWSPGYETPSRIKQRLGLS